MSDFEDALQVAAAVASGADFIVTRNIRDFRDHRCQRSRPTHFMRRFLKIA